MRWNKTLEGGLTAHEAAAAYVGVVKGLMIDTEEGELKTPARAIEVARDMSVKMPEMQRLFADIIARSTN